jgi:glycosyltransferase involved in cell wall biosynthesis
MRIVLIHRYFWPDSPPYAHILRDIAVALGERGHRVTVLTCQPSYDETAAAAPAREQIAASVEVRRFRVLSDRRSSVLKAVNLAWFGLRLLWIRRSLGAVDVVMAASSPPLAVARVGSVVARRSRARFIYHKQDIYPEVVIAPGILRSRFIASVLRKADVKTERRADRIVVLSQDMLETVVARGTPRPRVEVINNFDPWQFESADRDSASSARQGRPCVVFAGNLGRFQNLETILAAAVKLGPEAPLDLHFFGRGALAGALQEQATAAHLHWVHFHGHRPPDEVARFLRVEADIGIVSLAPGVFRAAYPSKTMSYLRNGCPVLLIVEPDSDLARSVIDAGAGFVASPTDAGEIARVLSELAAAPDLVRQARPAACALYETQFSREGLLSRWITLFEGSYPSTDSS